MNTPGKEHEQMKDLSQLWLPSPGLARAVFVWSVGVSFLAPVCFGVRYLCGLLGCLAVDYVSIEMHKMVVACLFLGFSMRIKSEWFEAAERFGISASARHGWWHLGS